MMKVRFNFTSGQSVDAAFDMEQVCIKYLDEAVKVCDHIGSVEILSVEY